MTTPVIVIYPGPIERSAGALFAEVGSKGLNLKEPNKREEFTNAVLKGCSSQAPTIGHFQIKTSLSRHGSSRLQAMVSCAVLEVKVG